ncbi:MAG: PIN domain-containing protein [Planctomycetota bacterium]|nr:PIN domain-containing protein [Planctomycetota bacterium]
MKYPDKSMLAIETNILMHAYREKFENDEQRDWHRRAHALLKQLARDEVTVCVSVISVSEYLVGIAESDRPRVATQLAETFTIAPFNIRAGIIAAGLVKTAKSMLTGVRYERPVLFADTKIIGSLVAHGCTRCETFDEGFAKLAATVMKKVNQLQIQPDLPGIIMPEAKKKK